MNIPLLIAALLGLSSVLLGAYGDHVLVMQLSAHDAASWSTALSYHQMYALVLLGLALFHWLKLSTSARLSLHFISGGFTLGIILFSGSIYFRLFTGNIALNFLTPYGGMVLILSWGALIVFSLFYHYARAN